MLRRQFLKGLAALPALLLPGLFARKAAPIGWQQEFDRGIVFCREYAHMTVTHPNAQARLEEITAANDRIEQVWNVRENEQTGPVTWKIYIVADGS